MIYNIVYIYNDYLQKIYRVSWDILKYRL